MTPGPPGPIGWRLRMAAAEAGPLLTRIDPHVHAGASECSRLTDEELLGWFDRHPQYTIVASDHMARGFYEHHLLHSQAERVLYGAEITVADRFDFLLLAHDAEAIASLHPAGLGDHARCRLPPMDLFADPRTLVTFAHPPLFGTRSSPDWPDWLFEVPVDFLEYNMARLAVHPRLGAMASASGVSAALADAESRMRQLRHELFPHARFIVGSDAHDAWSLGRTYLELHSPCSDAREVWQAVHDADFSGHLEIRGAVFSVDPHGGTVACRP